MPYCEGRREVRVEWPNRSVALSMPRVAPGAVGTVNSAPGGRNASRKAPYIRPKLSFATRRIGLNLRLNADRVSGAFRVLSGRHSGLRIQDIGSQSVVPLLDFNQAKHFWMFAPLLAIRRPRLWSRVLTRIACDLHWHRLQAVEGCARVVMDAPSHPFRIEIRSESWWMPPAQGLARWVVIPRFDGS